MGREVENARAWVDETSTRDSTELLYRVVAALREVSDDAVIDRVCKRTFWRTKASMGRQLARLRCTWLRSQRSWAGNVDELQCSLEHGRRMKNRPAAGETLLRSCTKPCCWYLQLAARHPHATSHPHRKKVAHLHHLRLRPSKRTLQRQAAPPLEAAPTAASQVGGSFTRNTTSNTAVRKLAFCTPTRLFAHCARVHRFPGRLRKLHITC